MHTMANLILFKVDERHTNPSGQARIDVKFVRIKEKKIHVKVLQKNGGS